MPAKAMPNERQGVRIEQRSAGPCHGTNYGGDKKRGVRRDCFTRTTGQRNSGLFRGGAEIFPRGHGRLVVTIVGDSLPLQRWTGDAGWISPLLGNRCFKRGQRPAQTLVRFLGHLMQFRIGADDPERHKWRHGRHHALLVGPFIHDDVAGQQQADREFGMQGAVGQHRVCRHLGSRTSGNRD